MDNFSSRSGMSRRTAVAASAIGAASLAGWWLYRQWPLVPGNSAAPAVNPNKPDLLVLRRRGSEHIELTYKEDVSIAERSLATIDEFFAQAKERAPEMIDDLLDVVSSVKILGKSFKDWIDGGNSADEYARSFLVSYLNIPDGLNAAVEGAIKQIDTKRIANEQRLHRHLEEEMREYLPNVSFKNVERSVEGKINDELTALAQREGLKSAANIGLGALITNLILQLISKTMGKALVGRAAVAGVATTAGAATSWYTFGVSLLVGMLVDYLIGKWQKADTVNNFNEVLDSMHAETKTAIITRMNEIADILRDARIAGWDEAIWSPSL